GSSKTVFEGRFVKRQQFDQVQQRQFRTHVTAHQLTRPRKAVPWTNLQAIVTTVNAVSNRRAQLGRNGPFQLNGQIRDTTPGIQLERPGDRVSWAGRDTTTAGTTSIFFCIVWRQLQRRDDLAQKDPISQLSANKVGMLAYKTEP